MIKEGLEKLVSIPAGGAAAPAAAGAAAPAEEKKEEEKEEEEEEEDVDMSGGGLFGGDDCSSLSIPSVCLHTLLESILAWRTQKCAHGRSNSSLVFCLGSGKSASDDQQKHAYGVRESCSTRHTYPT